MGYLRILKKSAQKRRQPSDTRKLVNYIIRKERKLVK
nr:MAG TPA: hypothetical protein [Caudoviricetes sp.]